MLQTLSLMKAKITGWALALVAVVTLGAGVLTQTGCGFLAAARESADAVRMDLQGTNEQIAAILAKVAEQKDKYDAQMLELKKAEREGDLEKQEVILGQLKIIYENGAELWAELESKEALAKQLGSAYEAAVKRVEEAATTEEKWGSAFGSVLQVGLGLLGLGGVGAGIGGLASASSSKKEAKEYKEEAEEYQEGLKATSSLLEKTKELAPRAWASVDKAAVFSKLDTGVIRKIDENRPPSTVNAEHRMAIVDALPLADEVTK